MRAVAAGADLHLEPQTARHAEAMFAVLSDPAIYEYENEPPATLSGLRTRFEQLESRRSPDGQELWLNWVVHLRDEGLIGYVQATVRGTQAAIAYEFASAYWGRGLARRAVEAMIGELAQHHGSTDLSAVLKRENLRSYHLLRRLRFTPATARESRRREIEADELLMLRRPAPNTLP